MVFKPSWSVQANFARIEELGLSSEYEWERHHSHPTLAKVFLEEQEARELYNLLKSHGLVVYKNWE